MTVRTANRRTRDLIGDAVTQAAAEHDALARLDHGTLDAADAELRRILLVLRQVVGDRVPGRLGAHEQMALRANAGIALEVTGGNQRQIHFLHQSWRDRAAMLAGEASAFFRGR